LETAKGIIDLKAVNRVHFSYASSIDGAAAASVNDEFRIYTGKDTHIFMATKTHSGASPSVHAWEAAIRSFTDRVVLGGQHA